MPDYYYLMSSLPTPKREEAPPLASEKFLHECSNHIDPELFKLLAALSLTPPKKHVFPNGSLAGKWTAWETSLRNRLASVRGAALGRDASAYLAHQKEDASSPDTDREISDKFIERDPLERERILDSLRWAKIEELEFGHYMDFDAVCAYRLKILIREKWSRRTQNKGQQNLNSVLHSLRTEKN
jgi:hypothetical protein